MPLLQHVSDILAGVLASAEHGQKRQKQFIRDLHNDPSLRKKPVDRVLSQMIEYGGPLLYHGGEDQQRSFDSTCRKFRRFLTETAR
jgi:hypothetical protein